MKELKTTRLAMYLLAVIFPISNIHAVVPTIERTALVVLYNTTGGVDWFDNTNWLNGDPCDNNWAGITCNGTLDSVTQISLEGNNTNGWNYGLVGTIPDELGNLSNLQNIYISANQLSGNIPISIGNLNNLIELDLSYNQLSGNIPQEIGDLSSLNYLYLNDNQLTGNILTQFDNLNALNYLYLHYNQLSGNIPASLGGLSNLQLIGLDSNQFSGNIPPELGDLSNLAELTLGTNQLTGSIPAELGNLNNLNYLWINSNQLSGSIPTAITNLVNLIELALDDNQLSGHIPTSIGNMASLTFLSLASNKLSGAIPVSFNNLTNFTSGDINYNTLSENLSSFDFGNWIETQTLAPKNIQVVASSGTSLSLNWDAITHIEGAGGYKVWMSDTENGIYAQVFQTNSKTVTAYTQSDLIQGQNYYFKLQSFTNSFYYNQNLVVSDFSNPIVGTTDITNSTSDIEIDIPFDIFPRQVVIVIGNIVSYKVNLKNNGPDTATAAGFRHNFPFGLINGAWSCTANSGGAICPSGQNSGNLDLTLDLPINATLEFTFDAIISADIIPDEILTRGNGVNINDIIPSSLLVTATATPPDNVEDSNFDSNVVSANIVELIFRSSFD